MNIHIIGSTGKIGSTLCEILIEHGNYVTGYSRGFLKNNQLDRLNKLEKYKHYYYERKKAVQNAVLDNADVICDLLCYSESDAKFLCDQIIRHQPNREMKIIVIGSIWVYDNHLKKILNEDDRRSINDSYSKNKSLMEKYILKQCKQFNLRAVVIHPGHVSGKGIVPVNFYGNRNSSIIEKVKRNETIYLPFNGAIFFQHVHVIDLCRLILKIVYSDISGESFNIACNKPISMKKYAELVLDYYNSNSNIEYVDFGTFLSKIDLKDREISNQHINNSVHVSINKVETMLDIKPLYTEEDIILEYLHEYENSLMSLACNYKNSWNQPVDKVKKHVKVSIIIPIYQPYYLENVIEHLVKIYSFSPFAEIILVDDSGDFEMKKYDSLKHMLPEVIKIIYHNKNYGRPAARNTGAEFAAGELLLFMDQDMFLNPEFINETLRYYESNSSLLFLGLRETRPFSEIPNFDNWISPNKEKDWRYFVKPSDKFVDLTVLGVGEINHNCVSDLPLRIYNKTDSLRNMGILPENTVSFWDLPSMVVSHTMVITKKDFINIGGFPEWIDGWGGEDIVLGFLSVAKGIPIILSNIGSFQAEHEPYSGSEMNKLKELNRNLSNYREWAKKIKQFPFWKVEEIRNRAKIY